MSALIHSIVDVACCSLLPRQAKNMIRTAITEYQYAMVLAASTTTSIGCEGAVSTGSCGLAKKVN